MQKIISQEEKDRKRKRNQLIIGLVLIFLMVFSTIGFAFNNNLNSNIEEVKYNGVRFIRDVSGYWAFNFRDFDFLTRFNPNEIQDIQFTINKTINDYTNLPLYYVGDQNEGLFEIEQNLNGFVQRISNACLDDCKENYPIKDCKDNIIIIREPSDERELIYQEENCVYIIANYSNQARYTDTFLFKILDI